MVLTDQVPKTTGDIGRRVQQIPDTPFLDVSRGKFGLRVSVAQGEVPLRRKAARKRADETELHVCQSSS